MIDIMLVLLIIFMIVTPLIANGFKAEMPKGKNLDQPPEAQGEVVLGIDAGGGYFLNGNHIPNQALEDQLRSIYSTRTKEKIMSFRAEKAREYGKIQGGVETAGRAGVRVMAATTEPKPEP